MEDTDQVVFYEPRLLLVEVGEGRFSTVLQHGDGTVKRLPVTTSAKDLITAAEIDYGPYRREIKRLREEHPLFAARLDIPVADFEDFVTETLLLPSMLQKIDPVGFFALGVLLDQVLQREDDGSALFLLDAAQELLHVLEEPICTQIYLRNILEMAFDGRERATQKERFEKLCQIYPQIGRLCDPASLPDVEQGQRVFRANSVFGLRMLELALYFQQDKQRIARRDYCWGWFIPKTKKVTRYCDRVTDGFPCKKRGARFKRNLVEDEDGALKLCNQLRDRMYARLLRWQDAAPDERDKLIPMDYEQYEAWSENARLARMEYLKGKLTAEEFLRQIDTTHELESYEVDKAELAEETHWQRMVAGDFAFDADTHYPEMMQVLDLGEAEPKWELYTADDLRREDQKGHQSLRERYGQI
ncbi:MAG: hypothetical protein HFF22_06040 [Oscillospiraceae bacterium]|nr:hypothetical protein [Oscillospiraceae bacterium]